VNLNQELIRQRHAPRLSDSVKLNHSATLPHRNLDHLAIRAIS
jgi:hypothetical protein